MGSFGLQPHKCFADLFLKTLLPLLLQLLFPASPAFGKDGTSLFVTNLELDLTSIGITQSVDSQWTAQVKRHSIAKLLARIPPISDKD